MKSCFVVFFLLSLIGIPIDAIDYKEYTLANGMKVCLVKTSFEQQSFCLELFALGGTSALSKEDRPSGMISAPLVCESGLGSLSSDELSSRLYKHTIEMNIAIKPFDRTITIHAPTLELSQSLRLAQEVFLRPRFDTLALQRVQSHLKNGISETENNPNLASKEFFLEINMRGWEGTRSLTEEDLASADIKKAQQFFQKSFSNPREFTCVIVGDIDVEATRALLESSLGSLTTQANDSPAKPSNPPEFPNGIVCQNKHFLKNTAQAITQITFPISFSQQSVSPELIDRLRYTCELIHAHLSMAFKSAAMTLPRIQVKYEFPNFPLFNQSWLLIAFASDPASVKSLTGKILSSLEDLRREGPSEELITNLASNKAKQADFWSEDNSVLLALLANIYRWGWDVKSVDRYLPTSSTPVGTVKANYIQQDLQRFIPADHYSVLTAYPINWKESHE